MFHIGKAGKASLFVLHISTTNLEDTAWLKGDAVAGYWKHISADD